MYNQPATVFSVAPEVTLPSIFVGKDIHIMKPFSEKLFKTFGLGGIQYAEPVGVFDPVMFQTSAWTPSAECKVMKRCLAGVKLQALSGHENFSSNDFIRCALLSVSQSLG